MITITKDSKVELLYRELRMKIARMKDGEAFPSVRQLMDQYRVSQYTVAPVLKRLRDEGLLVSQVGSGTYVHQPNSNQALKIVSFFRDWPSATILHMMQELEKTITAKGFAFERVPFGPQDDVLSMADKCGADAVFIDSFTENQPTTIQLERLSQLPMPVVLLRNAVRVENINYVCGNNAISGTIAANYLYQNGHRKIGVLFSEPHLFDTEERVRNFKLCAQSNHCSVEVFDCDVKTWQNAAEKTENFILNNFKSGKLDVTALFVISDTTALSAISALEYLGYRVPEDISVLGFGNYAAGIDRLTVLDIPHNKIALEAINIVSDRLKRQFKYPAQIEIAPEIIKRTSVKKLIHES